MRHHSHRAPCHQLLLLGVLLLMVLTPLDSIAWSSQEQPITWRQADPQQESRGFFTRLMNGEASWLGPFAVLVPIIYTVARFRDHHKRGQRNRERLEEERYYEEAAAVQSRPAWMARDASTSRTVRPAWMSGAEGPNDRPKWLSETKPGTSARPILPPLDDTHGSAPPARKSVGQ